MKLLLFLFAFANNSDTVVVDGLEIFQPIGLGHAALGHDGSLFVLDRDNHRFFKIGPDLNKQVFSRRGQGPGELERPHALTVINNKVVIRDYRRGSIFDENGVFLDKIKPKDSVPVGDYLIRFCSDTDKQGCLVRLDWRLTEEKVLLKWPYQRLQTPPKQFAPRSQTVAYNPAEERPISAVDSARNLVFIAHMGPKARVSVVHVETGALSEFSLPLAPVPMNKDWARQQLASLNEDGGKTRLTLDEQEFFPIFRRLWIGPQGELVFELWTGQPDQKPRFLVCDKRGQPLSLNFDPVLMQRLLGTHGDQAWLSAYSDEEGAYLVRCPINKINETAAAHPWQEHAKPPGVWFRLK